MEENIKTTQDCQNESTEKQKMPEMKTEISNEMIITVDGKEGKKFRFCMPFHTPLDECYFACLNAANEIARLFNEYVEKAKKDEKKKEKKE